MALILSRQEGEAVRYGQQGNRMAINHVGTDFVDVEGLGCQPYDTFIKLDNDVSVSFRRREYNGMASGQIKCAFQAAKHIPIDREEIWLQKQHGA